MLTLTTAQMKLAEKLADQNGLSFFRMMENAGSISYKYIQKVYDTAGKRIVILAGKGNNAGDGFVLARLFAQSGCAVTVILSAGIPATPLSRQNYETMRQFPVHVIDGEQETAGAVNEVGMADLLIDAVFGTGFHGELPTTVAVLLDSANQSNAVRIALDIPSGMDADTGAYAAACLPADSTLVFGAYKPAHSMEICKPICGKVELLDIGIPGAIVYAALHYAVKITQELVIERLPPRRVEAHKGDFGRLLNISGSATMGGAAMMSTLAAMRVGAGITRLATPASVAERVAPHLMEAMTVGLPETKTGAISASAVAGLEVLLQKSTACLIGCGLSLCDDTKRVVEYIVKNTQSSLVIDADGINCLVGRLDLLHVAHQTPVLTPHIGEMARLVELTTEQVSENAAHIAKLFAKEHSTVVVLKSHRTLVALPDGRVFENTTGNAGLAKGGSGDVLAGMIAGLRAQGLSAEDAAICGVYLHGAAADSLAERMSLYSILARDVIEEIPVTLKGLGL